MAVGTVIASFYSQFSQAKVTDLVVQTCEEMGFELESPELESWMRGQRGSFRCENIRYDFYFGGETDEDLLPPSVQISFRQTIYPSTIGDDEEYRRRMDVIIDLLVRLAIALDAEYVAVVNLEGRGTAAFPTARPVGEHVDRPPKIGLYSSSVLDDLGGLSKTYGESPWYVATLTSSHTLVIDADTPWYGGDWTPPSEAEHVVDGRLY